MLYVWYHRVFNFKSGYITSLNQKQKFVIIIVLIVLGNDGTKRYCKLVSMSYLCYNTI